MSLTSTGKESQAETAQLKDFFDSGMLRPYQSPYGAPLFFQRKADLKDVPILPGPEQNHRDQSRDSTDRGLL